MLSWGYIRFCVFFKDLVCIFVRFCVILCNFGFVLLFLLGFVSFYYRAKRLTGKNVSEMTYFVSSGT